MTNKGKERARLRVARRRLSAAAPFPALVLACLLLTRGTTTFAVVPEEGGFTEHRVRPGDTVGRLSWQYRVRADRLRAANALPADADALTPGRTLRIPLAVAAPPARAAAPATPVAALAVPVVLPATPVVSQTTGVAARATPVVAPPAVVVNATPRVVAATTVIPFPKTSSPPSPSTAATPPANEPPRPAASPPPAPDDDAPSARTSVDTAAGAPDFLAAARRLAIHRIRYGGRWTPPGERSAWMMDCSNTARWLYRDAAGLDLPRTASDQYETLRQRDRAWEVPRDDARRPEKLDAFLAHRLRPGDLLFWENTYRPVRRPDITHVMIYLGRDAAGRWRMAGSQAADGVSIYTFDPHKTKGGYSAWLGLVHRHGRFIAYGRPLD